MDHRPGIGFQLGRGKTYLKTLLPEEFLALGDDADGDGVKDTKDLCGGTEPGAWVDKNGCAIDTDADGVPDYRDAEIHSPDLLVNTDGISISLEEWNAMFAQKKATQQRSLKTVPPSFLSGRLIISPKCSPKQAIQPLKQKRIAP